MEDDLSYYTINKLLWRWRKKSGASIVHEVGLSMDKTPPALPAPNVPPAKITPSPKPSQPDPIVKMVDDFGKVAEALSRFKTWLNAPDRSEPSKTPQTPAPTKPENTVPPFDIQDIPGAMRKELMPVAARLMERWFAGELNYGRTDQDTKNEINQSGKGGNVVGLDRGSRWSDRVCARR